MNQPKIKLPKEFFTQTSIAKKDKTPISTGSLSLNVALGTGGFVRGRITEIYGTESSGKTTLALQAIAEVQQNGGIAAFVDAEHAFDAEYARALGVDIDNLYLVQPEVGEEAMDAMISMIASGALNILVLDSVAALTPRSEVQGGMNVATVGNHARLMSHGLKQISVAARKTNTCVIFTNQLRQNTASKGGYYYSNKKDVTSGGKALNFYASQRISLRSMGTVKSSANGEPIGVEIEATVTKNKLAAPFKKANYNIIFGEGVDNVEELAKMAVELKLLKETGTWYTTMNNDVIGQGIKGVKAYIYESPDWGAYLKEAVLKNKLPYLYE